MSIFLYNTLTRKKEEFTPLEEGKVKMYCCGPTVYDYQHIGNFRTFLFEDILKRVLLYNGYDVKQIMNITDVGHLVSDADEGEDKMEKGSARTGKTVWEIAELYTNAFLEDSNLLNIIPPYKYTKATDYIKEQIDLVKCLEEKGYTYIIEDGVYFDTAKLSDYGKLAGLDIEGLQAGYRVDIIEGKKNKTDFTLWKFSPKDKQRQMEWESPWGKGAPGWHVECSAMSMKFLGETLDIHCGGIDHVAPHHTNEIAQSEACTGKPFARYWLHGAFLEEESGKMSKSKGEFLRVKTLIDKGYTPYDYRYLCFGTHYKKRLLFSWELMDSSKVSLNRLRQIVLRMRKENNSATGNDEKKLAEEFKNNFITAVNDDLNMPEALAVVWGLTKETGISDQEKLKLLYDFDKVLGLELEKTEEKKEEEAPDKILKLVEQRTEAKKAKDFKTADEIRNKAKELGWEIVDTKDGAKVNKI
jgi:cysteinyl-tRNA synthetase